MTLKKFRCWARILQCVLWTDVLVMEVILWPRKFLVLELHRIHGMAPRSCDSCLRLP